MPAASTDQPAAAPAKKGYPAQALFVIFTEGAERLSYYGLTAILADHLNKNLGFSDADASTFFSIWSALVYLAPLFGGWVADRFLGRYASILYISFGYVLGHAVLSLWESRAGVYVGCLLIALGAGGIKPNVSVFMGDQFRADQKGVLERAYGWFYFAINVGSVVGIMVVPIVFERATPFAAFLIPGVAMLVAWLIFVAGRTTYTRVPPSGPNPSGFFRTAWFALAEARPAPAQSRLDAASQTLGPDAANGVRAVLRIASVFAFISVFWALFFQYGGSWQLQAGKLGLQVFGFKLSPGHISLWNSVFVLALIPVMNGLYARRRAAGRELQPLNKMMIGMYIAPFAFLAALGLQWVADQQAAAHAAPPHALWQGVQYFFLSLAEVLISITGLEFAFTQAPKTMKSAIMGVWFLCISLGGILSGVVTKSFSKLMGEPMNWVAYYAFFTAVTVVAAVAFTFVARWYKPAHTETAG